VAYVLDMEGVFPTRCNTELVDLQRINDPEEAWALRTIIQWHRKKTHSWRAAQLLAEWSRMHHFFWRVSPIGRAQTASDFAGADTQYVERVGAAH
jgi:glutamate synthase domain-containing protein 3